VTVAGEGDPGKPAERAIARFEAATDEHAGVIVVDTDGVVGSAHNTASMQTARTSGVDTQ
jgi:isoaspartyl peptidase/L-asparaginase-like protein (Ntn-hydrolase superfamily)